MILADRANTSFDLPYELTDQLIAEAESLLIVPEQNENEHLILDTEALYKSYTRPEQDLLTFNPVGFDDIE